MNHLQQLGKSAAQDLRRRLSGKLDSPPDPLHLKMAAWAISHFQIQTEKADAMLEELGAEWIEDEMGSVILAWRKA